jgi:acyl-ACP thioesterase
MSGPLITTLQFNVHGFDCGYGGPLRVFSLANFLQETAGENAAALGFGMEDLHAKGWTWMLSRLDLRVDELPLVGERVVVRTWPAGTRRLFALRDIFMTGADGRNLARAVYAYIIVDLSARRPLRPENVFGAEPPHSDEPHPVPDFAFDLPECRDLTIDFAQRVSGRHIDHNGHANNAHLLNWLVDSAENGSRLDESKANISALRVEFLAEALAGDELVSRRCTVATDTSPFGPAIATTSTLSELARGETIVARALVGKR